MNEKLKNYAEILRNTKLFNGTDDGTKWICRQMIFLVLAGEKKLAEVHGCHLEKMSDNEFGGNWESRPDDEKEMEKLFDDLGVKYKVSLRDKYCVSYYIALEKSVFEKFENDFSCDYYVSLHGYPRSAVEAWDVHCNADHGMCEKPNDDCPSLSGEEQEEMLQREVVDEGLRNFVHYSLSKANYKEELKTFERWWDLLKEYGLVG